MNEALNDWFAREILVHEAALVRYLSRTWPNRDEIHDLRQETYIRVYEAAQKALPYAAKSFLFTTARHLMADRLRRGRIVSMEAVGDLDTLNVPIAEASPEQRLNARQELMQLARAFSILPPKCREVVWLRRVDELSQKEVASRLSISEKTVESHVMKGTRLLADALFSRKTRNKQTDGNEAIDIEEDSAHGQQAD
ncbi:RNA polymerase sigma factor [Peristeroidobacter soli]|uniref:RNA polymerase sigma factor n=1 Tax=Peristeroidobacter soli TaxID=2497877 RepID=UPI00101CDAE8|nr:sigma-70 family RNA polymerase sigma factor [Peristeroidobacter soli]